MHHARIVAQIAVRKDYLTGKYAKQAKSIKLDIKNVPSAKNVNSIWRVVFPLSTRPYRTVVYAMWYVYPNTIFTCRWSLREQYNSPKDWPHDVPATRINPLAPPTRINLSFAIMHARCAAHNSPDLSARLI